MTSYRLLRSFLPQNEIALPVVGILEPETLLDWPRSTLLVGPELNTPISYTIHVGSPHSKIVDNLGFLRGVGSPLVYMPTFLAPLVLSAGVTF